MRRFNLFAAVFLGVTLSACSAMDRIDAIGRPPALDAVGNPAGSQIVSNIPMPPPISHRDNSLWQPGARSFFHDPTSLTGKVAFGDRTIGNLSRPYFPDGEVARSNGPFGRPIRARRSTRRSVRPRTRANSSPR